ncbi:hypothetical protein KXW98_007636 [Aspergillus fumigatus]|uniref:Uncharacterized protein n=1 Tax=Aspergillus fumigatus TaxID=746128 RepID=A0A229Y5K3_ASPFM|nr:hypothetical protein CNMCM8714_004177 [Aspergillus fumigatus]KMK63490.1 hypothetical protein Y699_04320 [Aspergillus fumigatus Z5]KAF4256439.1 hypothetical protein CNMCM8812_007201 [Aspergillus fumigatus]KAF4282481.1 hypothetical protein CNMCM8689_008195 [Aspergillus fumigatus]KAF4292119.1 hypothetical protein CNMCM8686_007866 [Aspergillus fumigatus]
MSWRPSDESSKGNYGVQGSMRGSMKNPWSWDNTAMVYGGKKNQFTWNNNCGNTTAQNCGNTVSTNCGDTSTYNNTKTIQTGDISSNGGNASNASGTASGGSGGRIIIDGHD